MREIKFILMGLILLIMGWFWIPWAQQILSGEEEFLEALGELQVPEFHLSEVDPWPLIRMIFWISLLYWLTYPKEGAKT